ncbi:MAG: hypothetical protein IPM29_15945 [Planctomycetes bacterium]|nr:hypothetical protein [Planctomycetota bacterium]
MIASTTLRGCDDRGPLGGLRDLLAPLDERSFRARWLEREPLHQPGDAARFTALLDRAGVDDALTRTGIAPRSLRVFVDERPVPQEEFARPDRNGVPRVRVDRVLDLYEQGGTLLINDFEDVSAPVRTLVRGLERDFGCPVRASVFVSPARSTSLPAHWDTDDVFVAQLAGSKRWRWWPAEVALPLDAQTPPPGYVPAGDARELALHTGDLLYLPRGVPHDAETVGCASIHLALAVGWHRRCDVLAEVLRLAATGSVAWRRALLAPDGGGAELREGCEALLRELLATLGERRYVERAVAALRARDGHGTPAELGGGLLDRSGLDALTAASELAVRDGARSERGADGRSVARRGDARLELPAALGDDLQGLAPGRRFRVDELSPRLDVAGRLTLARALIRIGFLSIVADPAVDG